MRILSRYIIRQFAFWLIISLMAFIAIYVIVDLIDHLDTFIDRKAGTLIVIKYYIYYIPYIAVLVLPTAMLLSSLFSIGGLARNNEIVAMKASGVSLHRILYPILSLSFLISCLVLIFGEAVVPTANQRREEIKRATKPGALKASDRKDILLQDVGGQIVSATYYNAAQKSAHNVSIERYSGASLIKRILARRMSWVDDGWEVENGEIHEFEGEKERVISFTSLHVEGITLLPSDFVKQQKEPEEMGYFELKDYLERVKRIGGDATRWLVDLYLKVSFPFTNFIIVLFGAPISSATRRTGKAMSFGICLFISFAYLGFIRAGQALGQHHFLHPIPAAWLANFIFGAVALFLLVRAHK